MKPQEKYDECLILLSELHDISHTMIEAGMDEGLSATQLIEEALQVIKTINGNKTKDNSAPKKERKLLH